MLIALSGGADSVALLLMMQEQGKARAAAHCNFRLRGAESDRDEQFVRRLCRERGIPLFVTRFDTAAEAARTGESVEMAARRLRYGWFARLCREQGFEAVAVAHHADDNAETFLLNLVRGAGLHGLTGMAEARPGVVRPLLHMTRGDILDYLRRKGQDYMTDSTNSDTRFRRNKVRNEVMPLLRDLNPDICRTLNATARRLAEAEAIYRYGAGRLKADICRPAADGDGLEADRDKLLKAPAPATLLHEWLTPYGFTPQQAAEALTLRPGALMGAPAAAPRWLLTRAGDRIVVAPAPEACPPTQVPATDGIFLHTNGTELSVRRMSREALGAIPREAHLAALDADCIEGCLRIRPYAPADRFRPFGLRGTKLVSDLLTERGATRIDKLRALVAEDDAGIVWLVGHRPAQRCAITDRTRRVVVLAADDRRKD